MSLDYRAIQVGLLLSDWVNSTVRLGHGKVSVQHDAVQ